MKITFGIITLNEESNLQRCLESIREVADEILIVDSQSTDGTCEIASKFGVSWHVIPWEGYVRQKNHVLRLAAHPWVFSIDADEALSPELLQEIRLLKARNTESEDSEISGYSMPRCVLYEGRWIRHGDWYPDRLVRLFQKSRAAFAGGRIHERLEVQGPIQLLSGELEHHSFKDSEDHFARCQKYARLWAEEKFEQGRKAGLAAPALHAVFRWIRGYLLRGGFLDGSQGLKIAAFCAYEVFLKYSLLRQMRRVAP
ncbi:MAG: glycosyltransferase family 2 protein [Verrucomicrobiota bacterium]